MTRHDFANLADGGQALGRLLASAGLADDAVLLGVVPNGVPVALAAAQESGLRALGLRVVRSDEGVVLEDVPDLAGACAVVIDDGVETGTVARAVVGPLRAAGVRELVLAVPVCPREAMADLALRYDRIIAVATPLVRRDLAWHYADFDTIDEATAEGLLRAHP